MFTETARPAAPRNLIILLAVAAVAAAAGGYGHYRAVAARNERLRVLAAETEQARRAAESASALLADDAAARRGLRQLAHRVPAGGDVSDLLTEISVALADGEVSQREVVTQPTVGGRPFSRVPLSLRLNCSFDQAFKLLGRIEGARRLTRVERLTISGSGADPTKPLRVEIEVSTFARDAEETATWAALQ